MVDHQDLITLWGEDGVRVFSDDDLAAHDFNEQPRQVLTNVGLPQLIPGLFEARGRDGCDLLRPLKVKDLGTMTVIGAVPGEDHLLFTISEPEGVPMLFDSNIMSIELINSTLDAFVEFLYRIFITWGINQDRPEAISRLQTTLAELDPAAFSEDTAWWPTGLSALAQVAAD